MKIRATSHRARKRSRKANSPMGRSLKEFQETSTDLKGFRRISKDSERSHFEAQDICASSPENTNRATGSASKSSSSSKKKKTLNMFFMAKKQKKLTMDNSNNVAVTTTSDTKMDVDVNLSLIHI